MELEFGGIPNSIRNSIFVLEWNVKPVLSNGKPRIQNSYC